MRAARVGGLGIHDPHCTVVVVAFALFEGQRIGPMMSEIKTGTCRGPGGWIMTGILVQ